MTSYPFPVPFYALVPTVQTDGDNLYIQTSFLHNALHMFSSGRIIHISNSQKSFEIRVRKGWQWQRATRIKYRDIDYIDLTYPRLSEHAEDQPVLHYDLFLLTRDPFTKLVLFRFGSIISDSPIPRKAAESCADLITRHTGIRLGLKPKAFPPAEFNDKYICKTCGHQLHPDSERVLCKYCGGKEIEIVAANAD